MIVPGHIPYGLLARSVAREGKGEGSAAPVSKFAASRIRPKTQRCPRFVYTLSESKKILILTLPLSHN